jgi:hypothetical protein
MFRRGTEAAQVSRLRFHDSRREAATMMSKKVANVPELSAVIGHRTLNKLKIYLQPDSEDLADKLG